MLYETAPTCTVDTPLEGAASSASAGASAAPFPGSASSAPADANAAPSPGAASSAPTARDAVLADPTTDLHAVLERYFGFRAFRPLQEDIIGDTLAGRDVLALMPTGGGKSLCYQLPALVRPGLTVVVSPLIALMKDQVDFLRGQGISAAVLNSTIGPPQMNAVVDALDRGAIRLLYVAPERLMQQQFLDRLARWNVAMFAIDEAHCISDWGHDFRPEYRMLRELRLRFPQTPIMALTATATDRVRADIIQQLGLREPGVYVASFNRPNLTYRIEQKRAPFERLRSFLETHAGQSGIVYCHTRRQTETLAEKLRAAGVKAAPYHAGLEPPVRARHQDAFLRDQVQVVCATIAFGMGVNKPNIRFVVHYDIPKNIESYYQETGRAGRDGDPAECLLLFGKYDVINHERRIDEKPTAHEQEVARAALEALVSFAESARCRRRELLAYFGERYEGETCEACDNCLGQRAGQDRGPDPRSKGDERVAVGEPKAGPPEDRTEDARRFLACIDEIISANRFSVGITHVADVLFGSAAERIRKFGHEKLKSYGSGKRHSKSEWIHIGKELVRLGLLNQAQDRLPVLAITDSGLGVLKGGGTVMIDGRASAVPTDGSCDVELFDRLKRLRMSLAEKQEAPAYVIFTDVALRQMAREYPTTPDAFRRISGVGEAKLAQLGPAFMREISEHLKSHPRQTFSGTQPPLPSRKPLGDSEYETLRRFRAGEPVESIARERGLKETTVLGHLSAAAEYGEAVDIDRFLDAAGKSEIAAAFEKLGRSNLTAVHEHLGGRHDYAVLRMYRAMTARKAA